MPTSKEKRSLKKRIKRAMLRDFGVPYVTLLDYAIILYDQGLADPSRTGLGINVYYETRFVEKYSFEIDVLFYINLHLFYLNHRQLLDYCRL